MLDWDPDAIDPIWRDKMVVGDDELHELSGFDLVMGHFSLPLLRRITAPSLISTVLREPRSRLLSLYTYWRLASEQPAWRGWSMADYAWRPLDDFLGGSVAAGETDNLVCRMLIGDDDRIPLHGFIASDDAPGVASRAIEALDSLGFVGVLELGESMWNGISAFFDVSLAPVEVNTTEDWRLASAASGTEFAITQQTLDLLETRSAADMIVYRHALAEAGYSPELTARIVDAAFANELTRLGNAIGTSASGLRKCVGEIEELRHRLHARDAELRRAEEDLAQHRYWLGTVQGSASWRLTAPIRTAKRRLTSPPNRPSPS
jgi:hypothetical protein